MLQARVLLCLSLAAVQVWAQTSGTGSGPNDNSTTGLPKCYQGNPWWTYMNSTSGDPCQVALQMRNTTVGSNSTKPFNSILLQAEIPQLCFPVVYNMYGACMACQASSEPQPQNPMMPRYVKWCDLQGNATALPDMKALAPDWAKTLDFTSGVWEIDKVKAAIAGASASPSDATVAPPTPSPTSVTPLPSSVSHKSSNVGPIVGGVIGGLALISIGAAALFFYLRLQRSRQVAPSSEFTKYIQPRGTQMSTRPETALSGSRGTIPRQDSATIPLTAGEDEFLEAPPVFTPGQYTGPVFEKDGYRADPNAPLYSSGNTVSQHSQSPNSPQGPSGSAF